MNANVRMNLTNHLLMVFTTLKDISLKNNVMGKYYWICPKPLVELIGGITEHPIWKRSSYKLVKTDKRTHGSTIWCKQNGRDTVGINSNVVVSQGIPLGANLFVI